MGTHCARALRPLNREDTDKCTLTITNSSPISVPTSRIGTCVYDNVTEGRYIRTNKWSSIHYILNGENKQVHRTTYTCFNCSMVVLFRFQGI